MLTSYFMLILLRQLRIIWKRNIFHTFEATWMHVGVFGE